MPDTEVRAMPAISWRYWCRFRYRDEPPASRDFSLKIRQLWAEAALREHLRRWWRHYQEHYIPRLDNAPKVQNIFSICIIYSHAHIDLPPATPRQHAASPNEKATARRRFDIGDIFIYRGKKSYFWYWGRILQFLLPSSTTPFRHAFYIYFIYIGYYSRATP